MKNNKLTAEVEATISAGEIKRLYEVLDNEGTPFEMEVKKRSPEGRTVKIHTEEKNVGYFSGLLNLNNK